MARYAHPEALASTQWLNEHLGESNLRVVDVRYSLMGPLPDDYSAGHIPGAVFSDLHRDTFDLASDVPSRIAPPAQLEAAMSKLGIDASSHVVVYDQDFGGWAARLWWALRYYGHDRVSLLNGGLGAWMAAGLPVESGVVNVSPATFKAVPQPGLRATLDEVVAALGRDDVAILDALPGKIYRGEALMFPNRRPGHIPGARNLSARLNIDRATGLVHSADRLTELWAGAGVKAEQKVITYCGAGDWGSFDLFILHLMGHEKAALYDGSWLEWGGREDLPVETGSSLAVAN